MPVDGLLTLADVMVVPLTRPAGPPWRDRLFLAFAGQSVLTVQVANGRWPGVARAVELVMMPIR